METRRLHTSGFSAIQISAALSVLILVGAAGWHGYDSYRGELVAISNDASATSSDSTYSAPEIRVGSSAIGAALLEELVSKYQTLQEKGIYTPEIGQKVAEEMASTLIPDVPFTHRTAADITVDPETSSDRALAYRHDLQDSLRPLLDNTQAAFEIFAYYTDTKDPKYLEQLRGAARNYRAAAAATAQVATPKDAVEIHLSILNALEQFAATLEAQVISASDPLASAALLRTYNHAEAEVFSSFTTLATYFKQKNS